MLRVATRLFEQKGYRSTSLEDIADVIGFTKPAIYYYFDGKEDILFEIHDRIIESSVNELQRIVAGSAAPAVKLQTALRAHLRGLLANISAGAVFNRERGLLSPEREHSVRTRERQYSAMIEEIYAQGVADGSFRNLDPLVAVGAILAACNWAFTWRRQRNIEEGELVEMLLTLVSQGYQAVEA